MIEWDEENVWDEIWRIVDEKTSYSIGQNLFYQIPMFADPSQFINSESQELIKDYHYCKDYHIPVARSLEEADANLLEIFDIIRSELMTAQKHKADNG